MNGAALVVMAKAPVPGKVKTRLQPDLSVKECASIYLAFILDTINLAVSVPQYTPFLAFTPRAAGPAFKEIVTPKIELITQTGRNLGRRMYHLMRYLEAREYSPIVVIGSDIPTLQPATLIQAIEELKKSDLCLGPSADGGYYLVGARHVDERIFSDVPWSTSQVMETTKNKALKAGLSMALLDEYSDVDTFADLQHLYDCIQTLSVTPGAVVPVHTKAWLRETGIYPSRE